MGTTVVSGAALILGITSLQSNTSNLALLRSPSSGQTGREGKTGGGGE